MKKIFLIFVSLIFLTSNAIADWDKAIYPGTTLINDLDVGSTANFIALDRGLASFCDIGIVYTSASTVTASTGSCVVSNSDGSVRVFLNNSSTTAITFSDIDTGSEAASTTYYVYAMAAATSSTAATFKISTSSSAPSGITYYIKIGSFYNDGSSNIHMGKVYSRSYGSAPTDSSGVSFGQLGDWVSKSWNTAYQALTDGFVVCYASVDNGDDFTLVTDSSASPSTVRQRIETGSGTTAFKGSMSSPVRKGDYYKCNIVSGAVGTSDMYFIPMGY